MESEYTFGLIKGSMKVNGDYRIIMIGYGGVGGHISIPMGENTWVNG